MKPTNKIFPTIFLFTLSLSVSADEVIFDDLIVSGGSLCVGEGCVDGEVFDFDSIKLKSPAPLIRFEDTSSSAAFPSQDWTMGIVETPLEISVFFVKNANTNTDVLQMSASNTGGVALGAGAELMDGAISVGSTGTERRIIHVADGVNPTDAVNLGQVQTDLADMQVSIDTINVRLDGLLTRLDNL